VFVLTALVTDGKPPLPVFLAIMASLVASQSLLVPNCASIAMAPMAAIAGTAAALMGATQTAGGALLGSVVDGRSTAR